MPPSPAPDPPATTPRPCPTVQLRHDLPDGSSHVDWMIAQDPGGRDPLISFRLSRRVDELTAGEQAEARRVGDHRPAYLDRQGPVSGGRGTVTRLARGEVIAWAHRGAAWHLEIRWAVQGGGPRLQRLLLEPLDPGAGGSWRVVAEAGDGAGSAEPERLG
jgi:hypothetical protein